jgi:hypothetical protein
MAVASLPQAPFWLTPAAFSDASSIRPIRGMSGSSTDRPRRHASRHDEAVTRDEVRRMLTRATGEAVPTCLATLDQPNANLDADAIFEHSATTSNLLTIYRRRASHLEDIGLPTLGYPETVGRLAQSQYERLRMVLITGATGHPWCVLFLAPDEPQVVAALAVLGPMPLA